MSLKLETCSVAEVCASLGESEKLLNELREKLEDWLKLQPHLPQDVPKYLLNQCILGTKMSLERAKQKLDMFYTMRRLAPEFLANRDPRGLGLTNQLTITRIVALPKLTPEKYSVIFFQLVDPDQSDHNPFDGFKYTLMIQDVLLTETHTFGDVYVFDQTNMSLGLIAKYTPTIIKKTELIFTKASARRIKTIHFINAAPITNHVMNLIKKIMTPKLSARVQVHVKENMESLYDYVPKSILPKDYGGDEQSMAKLSELWHQKMEEKRDFLLEQDKLMVNEKLRPGPAMDADDIFGFSGSFRKLDVD